MKKRVLIIDNEDQTDEIEKLIRDANNNGIKLECLQFNVGSTAETDLLTNGQIDIDKVVSEYKVRFKGITFNLVACDWDLSDEKIDGVELIRQLTANKICHRISKMLYSGLLDEKLSEKLEKYKKGNLTKSKFISQIRLLINADIRGFYPRENYDHQIISILKDSEDSLDFIIEDELSKFPELKFNGAFGNPFFNKKTYAEIIEIINHDDHLRNDLKREIIEHTIAYITEKI